MTKYLTFVFSAIILLSGCTTTPKAPKEKTPFAYEPGKYMVQIVEVENASGLSWDMTTKGVPSEETLKQGLVVDLFNEDQPMASDDAQTSNQESQSAISMISPEALEEMTNSPGTKVTTYPAIYVGSGETAIYDQTKPVEALQSVEVVDGKTVKSMETVKVGRYAEVKILESTDSIILLKLDFYNRQVAGTEAYTLDNGDNVEFTYFKSHSSNTITAQSPDLWRVVGAVSDQQESGGKTNLNSWACFIRVVPPEI